MSNSLHFPPHAVHLAFSTHPIGQYDEYLEHIKSIYEKNKPCYVDNQIEDQYYMPRIYRLFGHYDVLCVSLIDSYRFALRVYDNNESPFNPLRNITYQIQTGTPLVSFPDRDPLDKVLLTNEYPYINVCSLKLNNGLLIGTGTIFFRLVISKINQEIKNFCKAGTQDISFCVLNSYNWADITLLLLGEDPNFLAGVVTHLREMVLSNLEEIDPGDYQYVLNKCLYQTQGITDQDQQNCHCFVESQSILGIDNIVDQKLMLAFDHKKFSGQIEWDIKPGHFSALVKDLNLEEELYQLSWFKNGKTDMVTTIQYKDYAATDNEDQSPAREKILKAIRQNQKEISWHIRKTKTVPLFKIPDLKNQQPKRTGHPNVNKLSGLKIQMVEQVLKAAANLNLSRQLKFKLEKIFFNYNNSITDSISYIYLIDFMPFLEFIKKDILEESRKKNEYLAGNNSSLKVHDTNGQFPRCSIREFEDRYEKIVNAFEEAYLDRALNSYNYEDLNDFNIDFNVNTTQILSTYGTLIKMISPLLFDQEKKMLVRQNELNTVSNIVSINYNVFHLFEPPLIFNTIVKEICNQFLENLDRSGKFGLQFPNEIENIRVSRDKIRNEFNENYKNSSDHLVMDKLMNEFDLLYFQTDILKYFFTFNANTELYVFWSWLYYIQNTSLHSTTGDFIEQNFNKELIRILLIIATFEPDEYLDQMKCKVPELSNLWYNNFPKFKEIVKKIAQLSSFKLLVKNILTLYKDHTQLTEYPNSSQAWLVREMYDDIASGKATYPELEKMFNNDSSFIFKYLPFIQDNTNTGQFISRWQLLEVFYSVKHKQFEVGNPEIFRERESTKYMFFNCISYMTLRWYFEKMHKTIKILPEGYFNPTTNKTPNDNNQVFAYVDMKGGMFYPYQTSQKEAMKFNHAVFHALWHLGLTEKINLF